MLYAENAPVDEVVDGIKRILLARHGGEDFTIVTQQQMLDVLGSIIGVLTLGVAALGGISLLVGGVGIFTIMTIAVRERTQEIGLLRAIGARRRGIAQLFVGEAMLLSAIGGVGGLVLGIGIVVITRFALPSMPAHDLAALRRARARDRRDDRARRGRAYRRAPRRGSSRSTRCAPNSSRARAAPPPLGRDAASPPQVPVQV